LPGAGADNRNNCGKLALTSPTKETNNLLKKMLAIVDFRNQAGFDRASDELIEHGFVLQYLNGDPPSTVWVNAWTLTDLHENDFFVWVENIVEPFGGDVLVAGSWHDAGALPGLPTDGYLRPITINRLS
jgi:hypothetical protein